MRLVIDNILLLFNYFVYGVVCFLILFFNIYRFLYNVCNEIGRIFGEVGY